MEGTSGFHENENNFSDSKILLIKMDKVSFGS